MNTVSLKPAEKSDVPLIFDFLQKLALQLGKPKSFKGSIAALESYGFGPHPAFEVIIAYHRETAVGCILFFEEFSTWRCTPGIYVQDLFVEPDARGLGLGKLLIESAAERGRQLQASYLRLSVDAENQSGLEFYQAIDFKHMLNEKILMLNIEAAPPP